MSDGGLLPVGTSPPLSAIHPDDHAGHLWIVTILTAIYVLLAAVVRGHIKWGVYGADDYLLAIATIACFGQAGAIFHGLTHGLSKFNSITTEREWKVSGQSFLAAEILAVFTLCLAKCSVICLMHRVFTSNAGWKFAASIAALVVSVIWGIASMAALGVSCESETVLTTKNLSKCAGQLNRWRVITATDIAIDSILCLLPIALCWHLQMAAKMKAQVVLAFGLRFPVAIFSALHLASFSSYPRSSQPQFHITNPLLYQQAMLLWSLLSATIPNLKSFMKSFSTDFGLAMGLGTHSSGRDYPLKNLTIGSARTRGSRKTNPSHASTTMGGNDEDIQPISNGAAEPAGGDISASLRPDPHMHQTTVIHARSSSTGGNGNSNNNNEDGEGSIGSHGSQDLIIRKEVKWHVQSESTDRVEGGIV